MFKLYKKKDNSFSIELTGTISVDDSHILSYEQYKKQEEEKLVTAEIYAYLDAKLGNPYKIHTSHGYSIPEYSGFRDALRTIAKYLAKNGEI